jgi:hypothetical protein
MEIKAYDEDCSPASMLTAHDQHRNDHDYVPGMLVSHRVWDSGSGIAIVFGIVVSVTGGGTVNVLWSRGPIK